jgi:putative Mg2+ transporter-C (MgtC) family protein
VDDVTQLDILIRVVVAAGLGAMIGFERERHARAAGIRTHMLVAVGACLFTGTALLFAQQLDSAVRADVLRIASGIATGVGFIGAGTIITTGGRVKGLTTAATIWVTASVGIASAYGFLLLALLVAGPITLTILLLGYVEKRFELKAGRLMTAEECEDVVEERGGKRATTGTAGAREGAAGAPGPEVQSGLDRWRPKGDA